MNDIEETVDKINKELGMLALPSYRKVVTKSGRNVKWLLKNIRKRNEVSEELLNLLKELGGK